MLLDLPQQCTVKTKFSPGPENRVQVQARPKAGFRDSVWIPKAGNQ